MTTKERAKKCAKELRLTFVYHDHDHDIEPTTALIIEKHLTEHVEALERDRERLQVPAEAKLRPAKKGRE